MGGLGIATCFARNAQGIPLYFEKPVLFVFLESIFLFFFLLGLYAIVECFRKQLTIEGDELIAQSVFGTKRFRFDEVTSLDWGKGPRMRFVVKVPGGKLGIVRDEFPWDSFDQLVYLFRTGVPEDRQKNWHMLCHWYTKLKEDRDITLNPPNPSKGEVLITRRRYDWLFGIGFLVLLVNAFFLRSRFGLENNAILSGPLIILFFWIWMHFSIPKKGRVEDCILRQSPRGKEIRPLLLGMIPVFGMFTLGRIFPKYEMFFIIVGVTLWILAMAFFCMKFESQDRQRRETIEQSLTEEELHPERVFRWHDKYAIHTLCH